MEEHIPSPYNFVPVSDKIFCPEWANQVSLDIPFADGISGSLDIKITTVTPTYIRNTGQEENSFFHLHKDQALIPGSSLKGMLRNIVEIASFGQMEQVNNHRYSYRVIKPWFVKKFNKVSAGWLRQNGTSWEVTPCDWVEVRQTDLEKFYKHEHGEEIFLGEEENGSYKYDIWGDDTSISFDTRFWNGRNRAVNLGKGKHEGDIVFTGQPTSRHLKNSKKIQFIFYNDKEKSIDLTHLKDDFLFIYTPKQGEENDWSEYWQPSLEDGYEVPVFFLQPKKNEPPISMGLTRLYRLPYNQSIHDAIPHFSADMDLASVIFGNIKNNEALKGRVHVGHLQSQTFVEEKGVKTVLGTPKASYLPNYVEQNQQDGCLRDKEYKSYDDKGVKIRGWKRYSTKWQASQNLPKPPSEKVKTEFSPIKAQTTFNGKIRVHNLKPQELGALVWALTWGGDDNLLHNIGMGKPYGFGNIKIEIEGTNLKNIAKEAVEYQSCVRNFEEMMEKKITNWKNSSQILHLKAMANPNFKYTYNHKRYPSLGMEDPNRRGANEFVEYKRRGKQRVLKKLYE